VCWLGDAAADDSGALINPLVVDGQVRGATAHGIGNALYERLIYDDQAQPQTATFADYLLPSAPEIPRIDVVHTESPTPMNPLGVKGAGEGGTIPAPAAIAAAIEDALSPWNIHLTETPIEPARLVALIRAATAAG
jgi:aerobic carbon-monoxide dehydrogenase large subunit